MNMKKYMKKQMKKQAYKLISCPFHINSFAGISVLTALLFTLMPVAADLHAAPLESFLLFYSNSIQGETDPCG